MKRLRPTWIDVDLDAIRHNVRAVRPPGTELMAVVKANAYGHGDVRVARAALEAGATSLGVALVEEGVRLREAGIDAPILLLTEFAPGSEAEALAARLTPSLYSEDGLARLVAAGARTAHVKVDTGMHRAGLYPPEAAGAFVDRVAGAGLAIAGLWTHFARAEDDDVTTKEQLLRFLDAAEEVRRRGHAPHRLHAANSAAAILHPETHLDIVRSGLAMYGLEPAPGVGRDLGLRPALTWRSSVTLVKRLPAGERISYGHEYRLERPATIATIPVGYADGYPRLLSSNADVLIRGRRCRVAGSVTMDHIMADCDDLHVAPGDEVVVVGRQGSEEITVAELARLSRTIPYEVIARIGERVPREFEA